MILVSLRFCLVLISVVSFMLFLKFDFGFIEVLFSSYFCSKFYVSFYNNISDFHCVILSLNFCGVNFDFVFIFLFFICDFVFIFLFFICAMISFYFCGVKFDFAFIFLFLFVLSLAFTSVVLNLTLFSFFCFYLCYH